MKYNGMNDVFMVTGGKNTQKIEGSIEVAPTVGASTEAKQDAIIAAIEAITIDPPVGGATEAKQDSQITLTGAVDETAPVSDTASSGLNGRLQRIAQRLSSLITALGSPFQAGGSIGNTAFGVNNASGASAVNIQDGGNSITVDGTVSVTGSTVQDIPATSGGLSKFHLVGAATTNATNVKASAGQVYSITAFNVSAVPIFLKFHNTAGTPTAGSGVTDTFLIPANTSGAGMVINIDKGIAFATGIGITLVTDLADAGNTAIAANSVVLNIYYK